MADCLRTGSLSLDILLGGGWKPGTINEIWGEPGSGKTALAMHAVEEIPFGSSCLWLLLGAEMPAVAGRYVFAAPQNAEQAFEVMTATAAHVPLIVVDSANGLIRQRELDGDPDYTPHPQREYKDELNALKSACKASGAAVLFLSKPRETDRQPVRGTGISEKARDRVRLRIRRAHQDGSKEIAAANHDTTVRFTVRPGAGIDWAEELARLAAYYGLIQQRGTWYEIAGARYHGMRQLRDQLLLNRRLAITLDSAIRKQAGV